MIKNTEEPEETGILPPDLLSGIFLPDFVNTVESLYLFLICAIGLCCGLRNSETARIQKEDIKYNKETDCFYMKVWNKKTDFHNKEKELKYRIVPLHRFLIDAIKLYCKEKGIRTGYIFGRVNKHGEPVLDDSEKAIFSFYGLIKGKEKAKETGNALDAFTLDAKKLKAEMTNENIMYYSLRHSFETMLITKYHHPDLFVDYFMGHKPKSAMLANYLHINQVAEKDFKTFFESYGKKLLDYQDYFVPKKRTERKEKMRKMINEKSVDGAIDGEVFFNIINSFIEKKEPENNTNDVDDFFETV
jgi:integrase